MKKLVILISGRGSNMEAIVRACSREGWPARVAAVIANRPDAAGLEFAASHGIATAVVDHRQFPDRESFDAALAREIDAFAPDLLAPA
jgi:phosphoribosylglycinamide formyltransferase-1